MHIHEEGLIHRDIKLVNILIDKKRMILRFSDFETSK